MTVGGNSHTKVELDWLARGLEPASLRIAGELFCTSGIAGIDPASGELPERPEEQFSRAYANLQALLHAHGIAPEAIGLLTVFIGSRELRQHIDPPWLDMFPDSERRPARKTNEVPLPEGILVQLQVTGILRSTCKSIEIPGLRHRAPLPMGALVGSTVFSSVIGGDDPATGELVDGPRPQIEQAFANAARLMEQAGGSAEGINHLWAFMGDMVQAPLMLETYLTAFPDPFSRPARKTVPYALPGALSIQLQITGDTQGRTANFEVLGVGHHDPIPLASKAGHLLQSSGIYGIDPATSELVGGLQAQTSVSLKIIERLMAEAGGTLASIAGLTVLVRSFADVAEIYEAVLARFEGRNTPAMRFIAYPLPGELAVQFHLTGWI